jgi:hypothetical protein
MEWIYGSAAYVAALTVMLMFFAGAKDLDADATPPERPRVRENKHPLRPMHAEEEDGDRFDQFYQ